MGMHASAQLFYGIKIEGFIEEHIEPEDEKYDTEKDNRRYDFEPDEWLRERLGIKYDWKTGDYRKMKNEFERKSFGCDYYYDCGEYTDEPAFYISAWGVRNYESGCNEIGAPPKDTKALDDKLKAYLKNLNLEYAEPSFYLQSEYS